MHKDNKMRTLWILISAAALLCLVSAEEDLSVSEIQDDDGDAVVEMEQAEVKQVDGMYSLMCHD